MIQLISAIAVAALTVFVGPLLRGEFGGGLTRRISTHAALRKSLQGNVDALGHLDSLLVTETEALTARETYRLTRKINGGNLAALIFVAISGAAIVYGLVSGAIALEAAPVLFWVMVVAAVLVGLFSIALAATGLGMLYAPPKVKSPKVEGAAP